MDTIDIMSMNHDEAINAIMEVFGFDEIYAEFYYAIERGEIDGDMVVIDDKEDGL